MNITPFESDWTFLCDGWCMNTTPFESDWIFLCDSSDMARDKAMSLENVMCVAFLLDEVSDWIAV